MAKGFKTGGRTSGTPNRVSASARDALLEAFDHGGIEALVAWARTDPAQFYRLWGKLLPSPSAEVESPALGFAERLAQAYQRVEDGKGTVLASN